MGRKLVEPAMCDHAETERRLIAMLSPEERQTIAAGLSRVMLGNR